MPIARIVSSDEEDALRDHLARLGIPAAAVEYAAARVAQLQLLITGAGREALSELRRLHETAGAPGGEGLPHLVLGDADRAMGTALLSGRRDQLERLSRSLVEGTAEAALLGRALTAALRRDEGHPTPSRIGDTTFSWGSRTFVMGILNVTPDSFSDGGKNFSADDAVASGERMAAEGADLLDVGGESTRPGAGAVPAEEELRRVVPVIAQLAKRVKIPLSIDTTKAEVAEAAVAAGATLVNDVSGFKFDKKMASAVGRLGVAACAMHLQGTPGTMQQKPSYFDVVGEVMEHLQVSLDHLVASGTPAENILLDPGIGFGKTAGHNLFLLRHLRQLRALGQPLLVGASRKSFLGKLTGEEAAFRLAGSLAAVTAAVLHGADLVRVHDVKASVDAARVADAIVRAREGGFAFLPA